MILRFFIIMMILLTWLKPAAAKEPVKVVIVPSVLNMFIQYSILTGILEEDDRLFSKTLDTLKFNIELRDGFAYSKKALGTDDKSASVLMMAGPYPDSKEAYDADLLVLVGNSEDQRHVEVFMVGIETGRAVSTFIKAEKITEENFISLINQSVQKQLDVSDQLLAFRADEIIDPRESIVQYRLKNPYPFSKDMLINIDFDNAHEAFEKIEIRLDGEHKDGEYELEFFTVEGRILKMKCEIDDNEIVDASFDINYRPPEENKNGSDVFTLLTPEDYPVVFVFHWEDGEIANVNVFPGENPYLPHALDNIKISYGGDE